MSILIDASTTFIVQGITGREAVNLTRECLDYGKGARIVGGVTPGRLGRDVHGTATGELLAGRECGLGKGSCVLAAVGYAALRSDR